MAQPELLLAWVCIVHLRNSAVTSTARVHSFDIIVSPNLAGLQCFSVTFAGTGLVCRVHNDAKVASDILYVTLSVNNS